MEDTIDSPMKSTSETQPRKGSSEQSPIHVNNLKGGRSSVRLSVTRTAVMNATRSSISPKADWSSTLRSSTLSAGSKSRNLSSTSSPASTAKPARVSTLTTDSSPSVVGKPPRISISTSSASPSKRVNKPRTSLRIDLTKKETPKEKISTVEVTSQQNMETKKVVDALDESIGGQKDVEASLHKSGLVDKRQDGVDDPAKNDSGLLSNSPIPLAAPGLSTSISNSSAFVPNDEWIVERRELQSRARRAERKLALVLIFSATRRRKEKLMRYYFNIFRAICKPSAPVPLEDNDDIQDLADDLLVRLKSIRGDYA